MPALAADCSAINPLALCPAHELLRARHLAFRFAPGLLQGRRFLPCVEPGLLRVQPFRFVPGSDCSAPVPPRFARSQITLRSSLGLRLLPGALRALDVCPELLADCSVRNPLRFAPFTNYFVLDT